MTDWPQDNHQQWRGLGTVYSKVADWLQSRQWLHSRQQLLGGTAAPWWTVAPGQQIGSKWPVAAMMLECPLLLGILQHWLQPSSDPLTSHSSVAFASIP